MLPDRRGWQHVEDPVQRGCVGWFVHENKRLNSMQASELSHHPSVDNGIIDINRLVIHKLVTYPMISIITATILWIFLRVETATMWGVQCPYSESVRRS
jgi:hypothetical protein